MLSMRRAFGQTVVIAVFWIVWGGTAKADDVQVNTYTTDNQSVPSIGMNAAGDFVVVWASDGSSGTDSSSVSVQGQRYAPTGSAIGGEFQVNSYTTGAQRSASVAVDVDGSFIVVWSSAGSNGTDTSSLSIQGQRYASDGSTLGGEFQVNTATYDVQSSPSVGLAPDGGFVVAWESGGYPDIQLQRFASDGSLLGGEIQANTFASGYQTFPSVAVAASGNFVVAWSSRDYGEYYDTSARAQRYAADGSPLGGEFEINTYTTGGQSGPSVGFDGDDNFVAVWSGMGGGDDTSSSGVHGQRFATDGSLVGGEFQVNSYTTNSQYRAAIGMQVDGSFVVVWQGLASNGSDSSSSSIQGRRFASDASPLGDDFQINTYTTDGQRLPAIGMDGDGEFVAVWSSYGSGGTDVSSSSIQRTRVSKIFADGFESGNLLEWSVAP